MENWNPTFNSTMWFQQTETCTCFLSLYAVCVWCLGLTKLLTSYRTSTRGSGVLWVWYHVDSISIISLNHLCDDMLMMSMFIFLVTMFQCLCGIARFMLWDIWLNHFESLISIIGILFGCSLRIDGYFDLSFNAFQSLL